MANWSAAETGARLDSKRSADGSTVLSEAIIAGKAEATDRSIGRDGVIIMYGVWRRDRRRASESEKVSPRRHGRNVYVEEVSSHREQQRKAIHDEAMAMMLEKVDQEKSRERARLLLGGVGF